MKTHHPRWRALAGALGLLLADAFLGLDEDQSATHPPDTARSPLLYGAAWFR